jgi:hypothetical protein
MNSSHLKYIISVLGITTGIFAFGNLKANASEGQNLHKGISAANPVTTQPQAQTTTPVVIANTNISQNAADLQAQTITPQTPIEPQQQTPSPTPTPAPSPQQVPPPIETPAPSLSPGRETRGGSSYYESDRFLTREIFSNPFPTNKNKQ